MSRLVQITDFEDGKLKISSTCYTDGKLQSVIDEIENTTLKHLLGVELYGLFVAAWDLAPTPPLPAIYQKIYDAFIEENSSGCYFYPICHKAIIESKGMKDMLMNLIYFEFVRNQPFSNRATGQKKTKQENSDSAFPNDFGLFQIYNNGINSYQAIQYYINLHSSDYPTYKGQHKELSTWL